MRCSEDARPESDKATRLPGITISFGGPAFRKMQILIDGREHRPHGGEKKIRKCKNRQATYER